MKETAPQTTGRITYIRRRYPSRLRLVKGVLGIAPLADMVLLVLMFVILNSWIVLRPGVALHLPSAPFTDGARMASPVITLSAEGLMFFDDERTTFMRLPGQLADSVQQQTEPTLVIQADRRVSHESLVRVYTLATEAGFEEVVLATELADEIERGALP